ncbi:HNH endonuclease [Lactiplantibacillus pentosus]|uniref:HNH endonuclease n=1 Tax=Lactiplantibacillus pentosus TaxID=1589 RepID=UPI0021A68EA8|nr:HNH endonuclease [Lactiplantibacillus pentosus]MCT3329446.1 HNH endonuclease [Lactiplantibacillus pentosus]
MRLKHCDWRGCQRLIKQGVNFCDEHKQADLARKQAYIKQRDKAKSTVKGKQLANAHMAHYNATTRDPEANAFYHSTSWQHMRDYIYSCDLATCQVCGNAVTDRKIVDHIHPLKVAPDEKLNKDNLWVLCYRCHNIKTQLEESIKQQSNGDNKLAHISKNWWVKAIKEKIK